MLDAQDGDIILKGRNIRISATDGQGEVTITSGKHIFLKGSVTHIRGTNINILGTNNLSLGAAFVETTGAVGNEQELRRTCSKVLSLVLYSNG